MKNTKFYTLLQLFWTFFKIGLFTFGGGYAMLTVIERETVQRKKWVTSSDIADMVVIAESTPGVIAVNSATFVGYKVAGFLGALFATLGVVLPSFIVISALFFVYDSFLQNRYVAAAFRGVRACVIVLIIQAFTKIFALMDKKVYCYLAAFVVFIIATFTDFNVIWLILCAIAVGIIIGIVSVNREKKLLTSPLNDKFNVSADVTSVNEESKKDDEHGETHDLEDKQ